VDYMIWAMAVFGGGFVYSILDPMVETLFAQETAISTPSLSFLTWMWNWGALILLVVAPTIWVLNKYSEGRY